MSVTVDVVSIEFGDLQDVNLALASFVLSYNPSHDYSSFDGCNIDFLFAIVLCQSPLATFPLNSRSRKPRNMSMTHTHFNFTRLMALL
jgi:hypothetical protein